MTENPSPEESTPKSREISHAIKGNGLQSDVLGKETEAKPQKSVHFELSDPQEGSHPYPYSHKSKLSQKPAGSKDAEKSNSHTSLFKLSSDNMQPLVKSVSSGIQRMLTKLQEEKLNLKEALSTARKADPLEVANTGEFLPHMLKKLTLTEHKIRFLDVVRLKIEEKKSYRISAPHITQLGIDLPLKIQILVRRFIRKVKARLEAKKLARELMYSSLGNGHGRIRSPRRQF